MQDDEMDKMFENNKYFYAITLAKSKKNLSMDLMKVVIMVPQNEILRNSTIDFLRCAC